MVIQQAITETKLNETILFFETMWKESFNIDFSKRLKHITKQMHETSVVFYIGEGDIFHSVVQFVKAPIGYELSNGDILKENSYVLMRIGTLQNHRKKGYGSTLIHHGLEYIKDQGIKHIYIGAELSKIPYYSKFGFTEFGKICSTNGNAKYQYMKNI